MWRSFYELQDHFKAVIVEDFPKQPSPSTAGGIVAALLPPTNASRLTDENPGLPARMRLA